MFKKLTQSLLSGVNKHLTKVSSKKFTDPTSWHNTFYEEVVNRIDENIFSVLFLVYGLWFKSDPRYSRSRIKAFFFSFIMLIQFIKILRNY